MAKKQNIPPPKANTPSKKAVTAPRPTAPQTKNAKPVSDGINAFFAKYANTLIPIGIGVLTYIFMSACIHNQLTNWDDLGYIKTNQIIKDQGPDWLKNIFSTKNPVMGNYHPLTMLVYAIEYHHFGLDPWIYHFDSVIAHVLCTIAVYFFIKTLTGRPIAALVVGLLFGLHPMHVESVAWAAGRKDILYGIFFVMAMTAYVRYIRANKGEKLMWYISVLVLFTLSLLCKSVAVTLPVTLFVIDYLERRQLFITKTVDKLPDSGRKPNLMLIFEKIPLFGLSLLFGILSVNAQKDIGALASLDAHFTVVERAALGCYAFWMYIFKAIVPFGLSNFYPYPLKVQYALPGIYYVYPVLTIALAFALWKYARHNRVVLAGFAFFAINIVLLLQFVPVGGAIISDRYGYIPYIGFFFIAGWYVSEYFEKKEKVATGKLLLGAAVAYSLVLGFVAYDRCRDWYDSVSMWKDDIAKHPEGPVGYFYLGQEYFNRYEAEGNPTQKKILADSALAMFNMSIERKPDYINPIICVAELQRTYNQLDAAKATYYQALKINDKSEAAYMGLGVVYSIRQQFDSAGFCFRKSLALKPFSPEGHSNFANYLDITGKLDSSLQEYAVSISQNPDAYIPYMNRARIFLRQNKVDDALKDLNNAAKHTETGDVDYWLAKCYTVKGDKAQALRAVETAQKKGYAPIDPNFVNSLKQ